MSEVVKIAKSINLDTEKLLGDWIVCIPGFTLKKYRQLQRSRLSIFAMNCFGGLISNTLGMPFRSPLVNMVFHTETDCIRFLRAPRICMKENLGLKKMVWNQVFGYYHPIATLCNIDITLNHDPNFDEALAKWNKRKQRINWYNLFVTMYTEKQEILEEFDALPYGKKVCFVPFKSDLDSAFYINPEIDFERKEKGFYDVVNNFARGKLFYYDPFDMLLYGKKTQLIDM